MDPLSLYLAQENNRKDNLIENLRNQLAKTQTDLEEERRNNRMDARAIADMDDELSQAEIAMERLTNYVDFLESKIFCLNQHIPAEITRLHYQTRTPVRATTRGFNWISVDLINWNLEDRNMEPDEEDHPDLIFDNGADSDISTDFLSDNEQ